MLQPHRLQSKTARYEPSGSELIRSLRLHRGRGNSNGGTEASAGSNRRPVGIHTRLDPRLHVVWVGAPELVPVPEYEIVTDVLDSQYSGSKRLGHAVESDALLDRCERR
jgi:hypothetical protein